MTPGERLRATYEFRPVDHLVRREFYIWNEALERWKKEGLPADYDKTNLFNFDPGGSVGVDLHLGWCEPPYLPAYESKVVKDEGETEIIQDWAGRWLRVFKGRRHGFMPDYLRHPVTSMADWEADVRPRLDPTDPRRYEKLAASAARAAAQQRDAAMMVRVGLVGGYMYLRAMAGPTELLYMFHDQPELIRAMMRQWTLVMDTALARVQALVELDELMFAEDICYNHGLLISPAMFRAFLQPCYRQVIENARARQRRRMFFHVDTDGWAVPAVPLYLELGLDAMSPWEVASGCDVVAVAQQWPRLILAGGIDKRVLAAGPAAIEKHLQHILPAMVKRGGFIPTCDHGVPDDVSLESYLYYRRRCCELDH